MARTNAAFMSGVPELIILQLLAREEMYGYQLVRAIRSYSQDAFSFAEGVVYPALHSLESRGLLKAQEHQVQGRARIYYRTTAKGKKRLQSLRQEWANINKGVNTIIGGEYVTD